MWHLVLWFSWRGGARSEVGPNNLGGLFQPEWFCGSVILSCVMWLFCLEWSCTDRLHRTWTEAKPGSVCTPKSGRHWVMPDRNNKEQAEAASEVPGTSTLFLRLFIVCSQLKWCSTLYLWLRFCSGAGLCWAGLGWAATAIQLRSGELGGSAWLAKGFQPDPRKAERHHLHRDTALGFLPLELHSYKLQVWTRAEQARLSLLQLVGWWACI